MSKTYKLKMNVKKDSCFYCDKFTMSFEKEALELILTLSLCTLCENKIKVALAKIDRQPGEDDD